MEYLPDPNDFVTNLIIVFIIAYFGALIREWL